MLPALHTDANRASARPLGNIGFKRFQTGVGPTVSTRGTPRRRSSSVGSPGHASSRTARGTRRAESERDDDHIVQRTDHGKELRNQVDGRDDPYHRHQDGDLRASRHPRVLAQATDHGDASGEESGQLPHKPRLQSGGQQDQHRPRREQTPEGDKKDLHSVTVAGSLPHVKLSHHPQSTTLDHISPQAGRSASAAAAGSAACNL